MTTLLQQVESRLAHVPFTKEDSSFVEAALRTLEVTAKEPSAVRGYNPHRDAEQAFFKGRRVDSPIISNGLHGRTGGFAEMWSYQELDSSATVVPIGWFGEVIAALKAYDGLFDAATFVPTATGAVTHLPTSDDTANVATKVTEGNPVPQANPTLGENVFPEASLWSTGQIVVSFQLQRDSAIPLADWFSKLFAGRYARGLGANFISVLLAAVATGVTAGSPSSIAPDEIFSLAGSVDSAYANSATSGFLMAYSTLLSIRKLKATTNAYLFPPEFDANGRPTLIGKSVFVSPNMPSIAASNQSIVYGDLSRFLVRSGPQSVARLDEAFARSHQVGYQGFYRCDGALLKAGSSSDKPLAALVHPNS